MDTIIYFVKKRGIKQPAVEPVGMRSHMLIRVEMDVGLEEWFGSRLVMPQTKPVPRGGAVRETMQRPPGSLSAEGPAADDAAPKAIHHLPGEHRRAIFHPLRSLMQLRRNRKEKKRAKEYEYALEQENRRLRAEREALLAGVELAMEKLSAAILDLTGDYRDCYCVYDDSVRKGLVGKADDIKTDVSEASQETVLPVLWRKCFPVEEFGGYKQQFWVEQLLSKATLPHFLILGTASCVFTVIEQCAARMKSLRWILPEEDCGEDVLDFVEEFYTEYGLAITLQPVESWTKKNPAGLRRLRLKYDFPINVIDFTEETHGAVSEMAEGSIWLDMCSVEEKKRRIMSRNGSIAYISLKEKWKQAQRFRPFIP